MAYDPLGINKSSDYDPLSLDSEYDPLGLSSGGEVDYSPLRSGVVDFVESAVGVGDEADALIRRLSGEAGSWDEALTQSRKELDAFEEENSLASKAITGAGMAAAFLIPGAGAMKIAQTGSAASRAAKMAALAGAEGAAYGFSAGRGDERLETAALGGVLGGSVGGLMGRFLTKNADDIARIDAEDALVSGRGTHIGGDDGFVDVGKASETKRGMMDIVEESTQARSVMDIDPTRASYESGVDKPSGFLGSSLLGTRAWIEKNVGVRAARLVEDSELIIRNNQQEIDELFDETMKPAFDALESNKALKAFLSQVGSKSAQKKDEETAKYLRVAWDDVKARARNPQELALIDDLKVQVDELKLHDFAIEGIDKADDYFPRLFIGEAVPKGRASVDDYDNPVVALKNMAEDISAARTVAARFNIDVNDIVVPKGKSRLSVVLNAVEKKAVAEGASEAVAANLANGLRTTLMASKRGGEAAGALLRKTASTALLANPLNAILNISEGITAPIYQNGIKAWAATIPSAIKSTFMPKLAIKDQRWLSNREIGLDKQFMGELTSAAKKGSIGETVDTVSKFLYDWSGAGTANRMGQEILSNSAVRRGADLAKRGDLEKLAKHDGARGLTRKEVEQLAIALRNGDVQNPSVKNFAAVSMNKWQPVSASALPKAFNDHPNGRVFYSMLSYMNRQMNSVREDIGMNLLKVNEYGLNTPRGQEAYKAAMTNAAKYTAMFGLFAGVWNDARNTIDFSNDKKIEDLLTPDGVTSAMLNQFASNLSSGFVNIRAEEYGGSTVDPMPAPISMVVRGANALASVPQGDFDPAMRFGQSYVPGLSQVDRLARLGMFSPKETAEAIMQGNAPKAGRLFEELGLLEK